MNTTDVSIDELLEENKELFYKLKKLEKDYTSPEVVRAMALHNIELAEEIKKLKSIIGHATYIIKKSRCSCNFPAKEWKEERELFFKSTENL